MKICGIIVEYNPFHNGHLYHLNQAKKISQCDLLIAVMSGNFVQRGEPSIIDKHLRTKLALQKGVDLVVELPYLYAVSHADLFSFGAISILNHCGVDEIIFGSEINDSNILKEIALFINKNEFNDRLRRKMKEGYSYPKASSIALSYLTENKIDLLSNDILGIQYIRSIQKINKNISFKTIKRIHSNYHDETIKHEKIASATSIRQALIRKEVIDNTLPKETIEIIKNNHLHDWHDYFSLLKYKILSCQHLLHEIHDVNEGLDKAMIQNIHHSNDFNTYVSKLVTKRYTRGKIQRTLTHILNHVTKKEVDTLDRYNGPKYVRILGFNKNKSSFIKTLKKNSSIPFVTNITKSNYHLLKLDLRVNENYHLVDHHKERKIPIIYQD